MKTTLRAASILFAFAVILTFASASYAQKVGGYKTIDKSDAGAAAAAQFAVKTQADKTGKEIELVSVFSAERQTVAGANYRLCLKVTSQGEENEADVTHFVKVVVYVNLKRVSRLMSWETSDCGEEED